MESFANEKRDPPPLSRDRRDHVCGQDTAKDLSRDSLDAETAIVLGNGGIRGGNTTAEAKRNATPSWSGGTYDSTTFKLKANELLRKIRPDYERRMVKMENSLRRLKDIIERIPDREAKPVCYLALLPPGQFDP